MMARDRRFQGEVDELRTTLGVAVSRHPDGEATRTGAQLSRTAAPTTMAGPADAVQQRRRR